MDTGRNSMGFWEQRSSRDCQRSSRAINVSLLTHHSEFADLSCSHQNASQIAKDSVEDASAEVKDKKGGKMK